MKRLFIVVAAAVLWTAACSSDESSSTGGTVNQRGGTTAEDAEPPTTSSASRYQRPRDIRLDDVEPCSLLTPDQRTELQVQPGQDIALTNAEGRMCRFDPLPSRQPNVTFQIVTALNAGFNFDVNLSFEGTSLITVADFPGITEVLPEGEVGLFPCTVKVPTYDKQYLWFEIETGIDDTLDPETACELTTRLATMAVETLQELH